MGTAEHGARVLGLRGRERLTWSGSAQSGEQLASGKPARQMRCPVVLDDDNLVRLALPALATAGQLALEAGE